MQSISHCSSAVVITKAITAAFDHISIDAQHEMRQRSEWPNTYNVHLSCLLDIYRLVYLAIICDPALPRMEPWPHTAEGRLDPLPLLSIWQASVAINPRLS
jgi:hypothetical protein